MGNAINSKDLLGTGRDVRCPKGEFKSLRILLERDNLGFSLTETTISEGTPQVWHYKQHLEACYCLEGRGVLTDIETGLQFTIVPGTTYILDKHDRHQLKVFEKLVLLCVFKPPLKGKEVHREDGSY